MGKCLDIVREARKQELESSRPESEESDGAVSPSLESPITRGLLDAGWTPKVSFGGKVIWERPDNGFYCPKELALHFVERSDESPRGLSGKRGNGKEVTQR